MPRIVKSVENVIAVPAGQLPGPSAPYWYSDKGGWTSDGSGGTLTESGGQGGTMNEGEGFVVTGNHSDKMLLFVEVIHWGGVTALELAPEITRRDAASEFGSLDSQLEDADNIHTDVKPLRYLIQKSNYPADGVVIPVRLDLICTRLRFGLRAALGAVGTTEQMNVHVQLARTVD